MDAHALTDTPQIAECIDASADAAAARSAVERFADAAPADADLLTEDPTIR